MIFVGFRNSSKRLNDFRTNREGAFEIFCNENPSLNPFQQAEKFIEQEESTLQGIVELKEKFVKKKTPFSNEAMSNVIEFEEFMTEILELIDDARFSNRYQSLKYEFT